MGREEIGKKGSSRHNCNAKDAHLSTSRQQAIKMGTFFVFAPFGRKTAAVEEPLFGGRQMKSVCIFSQKRLGAAKVAYLGLVLRRTR